MKTINNKPVMDRLDKQVEATKSLREAGSSPEGSGRSPVDPPTPPDEAALRRPTFLGGHPIAMPDGRDWWFPRPVLEFTPRWADDGSMSAGVSTSLGEAFDRAILAYDEACRAARAGEEAGEVTTLDLLMAVGVTMLLANYDLDRAGLTALIRYRPDDPESDERWGAILGVARGIAPKPRAGG